MIALATGAITAGSAILPKVLQGGLKLFKGIGKKIKGIGKGIGKAIKKRKDKRNGVVTPEPQNLQPETTNIMENEQIDDSSTNTQKAFLGLQSVEAGKKQQSKIIMIAGAVVLLLFFMMKKK
jgi:hypothetical protein